MRHILSVILCLGSISLAISTHALVQYVRLGSKVKIPCEGYGDRRTGKWLHRNDDNGFAIIAYEMSGYIFQSKHLSTRRKTTRNFSLEISPFTELDKGTYVCEVCRSERCTGGKPITLLPQFDVFSAALSTLFVIEDEPFSYSCLYNLTLNADWRFEAFGEQNAISVNGGFTDKNVLLIPDVQPNNAGKYSYWGETSTGQQQRMCSVNLCVLSVKAEKLTDSPQNCTLYCDADMDANEGGMAFVGTDKWNISFSGRVNKPKSSLSCRLLSSDMETHTLNIQDTTTAVLPDDISSITTDNNSHYPVAALISTAFFFIMLMALFILLCISRQRADKNSSRSANGHLEGEVESQKVCLSVLPVSLWLFSSFFIKNIPVASIM
ncbi:uncharacterized protein LOC113644252 isoform X2 [Tachysurus fulvidraco]|uniref:uncharacterized protein LOC113644252 isoform X2 n=1 Tax=Tachysurus fulvidraco TaxID=1234273 RepID=UPI000F50E85D|nr:uncharacterized protein LOC113644252 isoform X2 [Tachysurus fulvidraco]